MTDQCKHCTQRGNLTNCLAEPCWKHEDWYPMALKAEIDELVEMLEGAGYKRQGDCWVSSFISSVCDKGTKGCIAKHKGE